jgi:hypothetical protein
MIKLEVRQAQQVSPPGALPVAAEGVPVAGRRAARVAALSILVAPPNGAFVLAQDAEWVAAIEKENGLAPRLASGMPFVAAGRKLFVTGTTPFPGGRILYQCVTVVDGS